MSSVFSVSLMSHNEDSQGQLESRVDGHLFLSSHSGHTSGLPFCSA